MLTNEQAKWTAKPDQAILLDKRAQKHNSTGSIMYGEENVSKQMILIKKLTEIREISVYKIKVRSSTFWIVVDYNNYITNNVPIKVNFEVNKVGHNDRDFERQ